MTYPLSFGTKRRSSFGFESSLVFRGRFSIGHFFFFFDRGGVYSFEGCSEVYMYFTFFLVTLASCTPVL